ncbi:penicillin acylase family protein [Ramlibacter sp. AN1015]|uniref:penicillin acylase family protein n=1 Tax=Ramlibacter sp. AN1015 TaxID=3133428 RepID=UPI0030BE23B8
MRVLKIGLAALGVLLALVALLAAVLVWRSFPALDGELRAPGLAHAVHVRRDEADVTHIEARSLADATYALGYVHAQERGWQLEFNRRLMRGELSELFGPSTLATDRMLRTLGIVQAAQAQWERLPPEAQRLVQAYADGINGFHAGSDQVLSPEFHLLQVRPGAWTPQDSMGWALMMALDLGGNWGTEFARLSALQRLTTGQLWQLMPPYPGEAPATQVDLAALYHGLGVYRTPVRTSAATPTDRWPALDAWLAGLGHLEGIGSNNWVIDGSRSTTGKPLLANDPHLGLSAPAIWYFARLQAPAGPSGPATDVIGATLPGLPSVVLGRTTQVAWGFTNTGPDVQDLYLEQVHADDPGQYRTPEGWAPFARREEIIRIKGQAPQTLVVRSTRHGPVISDVAPGWGEVIDTRRYAIALRWAALDADNATVLAGLRANAARSVDELLEAFDLYHSPMQNVVAADTGGRTAFQAIGRVPQRAAGNDLRGVAPAPGWDARYDWTGWLAPEQTPRKHADAIAARGWHATANQRIHGPDYPHFLGADWSTPERFERIETLLEATPRHDLASMRAVQADTVSLATRRLLPVLQATTGTHPLAAAARKQLQGFDGDMRADGAAPLIFAVWADELTRALVVPRLGQARFDALYGKRSFRAGLESMLEDPQAGAWWCAPQGCAAQSAAALDRALERIASEHGREVAAWRWGAAHPALSTHRPFGNVAALARWFDVRVPTGGDAWTVNVGQYAPNNALLPFANRHAASLRALYDLADLERSQFIYQTGQSGLVFSPRYRDMSDAWAQVQYRPLQLRPARWAHQATLQPAP